MKNTKKLVLSGCRINGVWKCKINKEWLLKQKIEVLDKMVDTYIRQQRLKDINKIYCN